MIKNEFRQNTVLILSGYNLRGIIAFCRFCTKEDIPFYIVAANAKDPILLSAYKKNVISIRSDPSLSVEEFIEFRLMISKNHPSEKTLILPSTEYLNRFLLKKRIQLEKSNFIIPLCSEKLYHQISDKYSFGILCQAYEISIPNEISQPSEEDIPFVAKPKKYFDANNRVAGRPLLILNDKDFHQINQISSDEYYYQEFVEGESYYLLYYFDGNGNHSIYSQKNLIQQANGLSIIGAESSDFHHSDISQNYTNLFTETNFRGLVMIEVKVMADRVVMIEANPRIWGPSQLILDSGMDLFHRFAIDYDLLRSKQLPTDFNYKLNEKYFWSGGIVQDQSKNKSVVFHNFTINEFFQNFTNFNKKDIYCKKDSFRIYLNEYHS